MNLFGRMIILFWMFWGRSIGAHRVYFFFCLFFLYRMFSSVAHCHISRTVRLSPCDILYWMFDIESCLKIYFVQICFVYMFRWMLLGFFSIVVFWSFLRFCWPLYCFSCSVTCMFKTKIEWQKKKLSKNDKLFKCESCSLTLIYM